MLRLALAIVFVFGAVVALAFAFNELCDGFETNRGVAILVAAACIGGLVGIVVAWRSTRLPPTAPWAVAVLVTIVAFIGLTGLGALMWAGECSR